MSLRLCVSVSVWQGLFCETDTLLQYPTSTHTHTHTHNPKHAAVKWNIKAFIISLQAGIGADPKTGRGEAREGGEKRERKGEGGEEEEEERMETQERGRKERKSERNSVK